MRRTALPSQLLARKSIDKLIRDSEEPEHALKKTLGPWSLTALGIGAVIGSGIFTVIGTAISGEQFDTSSVINTPLADFIIHHTAMAGRPGAGPAIALSLVLVAIVCALTGLCYAELASMIPIAGSAYTYTYATMGELIAWIIGWDLILEYAGSNMTVSVGFAAHVVDLLDWFGLHPSAVLISPAYLPDGLQDLSGNWLYHPGWHFGFNIPAFLIVLILTVILVRGIRESAETNNTMVGIKLVAIVIFVLGVLSYIHPANWHPFTPNGFSGILTGGSIIFFTYIGFDSVSTAAEECRNPQRDLPIGIIATLIVCTVLYVAVAVCLTGLVPWQSMVGDAAPVVNALKKLSILPGGHPLHWIRLIVLFGAIMGMLSSILVYQLGQSRVWFSMSRDGLLPKVFSDVHPVFRTPAFSTWVAGFVVAIPSGLFDIGTLADLSNIGTLFAFVLVSIGVIVLRYREPDRRRGFKVPFGPVIPLLSVIFCFLLMAGLPIITWMRFVIWLVIGLAIYFTYGFFRSEFAKPLVPLAIPLWVVLLLSVATLGLFPLILLLMQASFVGTLDRRTGTLVLSALTVVCVIASTVVAFYSVAISRMAQLAAAISFISAIFKIRQSMLSHYNRVEPIGLRLSGAMTLFFGSFYLQYHLSRIAKWKQTGILPPQ
ncbi:MAG TPA: amino acid permease [Terracidiphilus sp.]|nr:amino acid permease [Terracidiphilus sp.]